MLFYPLSPKSCSCDENLREGRKTNKNEVKGNSHSQRKPFFFDLVLIQVKNEVKYSPVAKLTPE